MTKAKKAVSLALAVVMVLTAFAFNAFASIPGNVDFTVTSSKTASVKANDVLTITVKAMTDYNLGTLSVPVHFDATLFEYVAGSFTPATDVYGAVANAQITQLDTSKAGVFKVSMYPDKRVAGAVANVYSTAKQLFTFQLKAKAEVTATKTIGLDIANDQKTATNYGELIASAFATSNVKLPQTEVGQKMSGTNATITGSAPVLPAIQAKAGKTGVIDTTRRYVYGITPGANVADYFEATNGGTLQISGNGTGATVKLMNGSTVVETYTVIIFGDVTGDALVDSNDAATVMQKVAGGIVLTDIQVFAADLDLNKLADANDVATIMQKVTGSITISVNPYA